MTIVVATKNYIIADRSISVGDFHIADMNKLTYHSEFNMVYGFSGNLGKTLRWSEWFKDQPLGSVVSSLPSYPEIEDHGFEAIGLRHDGSVALCLNGIWLHKDNGLVSEYLIIGHVETELKTMFTIGDLNNSEIYPQDIIDIALASGMTPSRTWDVYRLQDGIFEYDMISV